MKSMGSAWLVLLIAWAPLLSAAHGNQGGYGYGRLTGTYRLDFDRSDNPQQQADQATSGLPGDTRQRVEDNLMRRLQAPEQLAIEQRGRLVTIASSKAPRFTLEADGQEHVETFPDGHTTRASANIRGDQLVVSTLGDRDSDFSVTFEPLEGGRRLRVIRQISTLELNQPVVVTSVYERTSDLPQFSVYSGRPGPLPDRQARAAGDFVIPNGETLIAVLNNDISTRDSREGDRFSMTVRRPPRFEGAVLEGTIQGIARSGRVTGRSQLTFNFERIRMRDGRTYNFAGTVTSLRTPDGQNIRVDNEGAVQQSSQTTKTEERGAIGAGVGALIGAIAGGGKGAGIGAILGGGAGAGSVYAEGRGDLILISGTEVTLQASAPGLVEGPR